MKKFALYLIGFTSFCLIIAGESNTLSKHTKDDIKTVANTDKNPYSVEKQYAKADLIEKNNKFYNLKKVDDIAVSTKAKDKYYSLIDIYKLAVEHNAAYQAAKSAFLANLETAPKALGALFPQVNFSYRLTKSLSNSTGVNGGGTSNRIDFNASQLLFDWSKWKTFTQARYLQKSYAMIYAKAEQALIVNTITAYFGLLRAQQVLQFYLMNQAWIKKLYLTQKYKYQSGIVSYADFKTADTQYRKAIADTIDAQKNLIGARSAIARLTGQRVSAILYVSKDRRFGNPVPDNIDYWLSTSQKQNLDIVQKEFEHEAKNQGIGIRWGNFFPKIGFNVGMSISTFSAQEQNLSSGNVTSVAGQFSWNLLSGGSDYSRLKQASYNSQAANYALLQTKREVYAKTLEAFQTVVLDAVRVDAFRKSIDSGIASVKAISQGLKAGTQTIVDLLNRQAIFLQTQFSFANSIFSYIQDYIKLKQLQGSLTYKDIEYVNAMLGKTDVISQMSME